MKKYLALGVVVLLLAGVAAGDPFGKDKDNPGRMLTGRVTDRQDNPLPNAVVYLTNPRNRSVKTFIVGPDGQFRFPALSPSIDYEVYAQYKGKKSDSKTVSQFDNRPQVTINLKIDMK